MDLVTFTVPDPASLTLSTTTVSRSPQKRIAALPPRRHSVTLRCVTLSVSLRWTVVRRRPRLLLDQEWSPTLSYLLIPNVNSLVIFFPLCHFGLWINKLDRLKFMHLLTPQQYFLDVYSCWLHHLSFFCFVLTSPLVMLGADFLKPEDRAVFNLD